MWIVQISYRYSFFLIYEKNSQLCRITCRWYSSRSSICSQKEATWAYMILASKEQLWQGSFSERRLLSWKYWRQIYLVQFSNSNSIGRLVCECPVAKIMWLALNTSLQSQKSDRDKKERRRCLSNSSGGSMASTTDLETLSNLTMTLWAISQPIEIHFREVMTKNDLWSMLSTI